MSVPVFTVVDGSRPSLRLILATQRGDVPVALQPGQHVVVRGVPRRFVRSHLSGLVKTTAHFDMWDPRVSAAPGGEHRVPGIDGPLASYPDVGPLISWQHGQVVARILRMLSLPETLVTTDGVPVPVGDFRLALDGVHRPTNAEQMRWAWGNRDRILHTLANTRTPPLAMPQPRLIKTPQDAERHAAEVMEALGFTGVSPAPPGRDGGVDVRSREAVAQVKLEGIKTDAPRVQALSGIAAHERRRALYFSLSGYTAAALKWAEQAGVALFEFDYSGEVVPRSSEATKLQAGRQIQQSDNSEPA